MIKKFNFIIEGKIVKVYESDFDSAQKLAFEIIEKMKRLSEEN